MKKRGCAGRFLIAAAAAACETTVVGRRRAADHHVEFSQARLALVEGQGGRAELRGELHRPLQPAAGDGERGGAAALEGLRRLLSDVARADEEDAGRSQPAEDRERQVHGHVRDADLAHGDGRSRADVLGRLERLLEHPVEDGPRRMAGLRRGVRRLDLAEDLGLAEHLRVQADGDLEEVQEGLAPAQVEAELLELGDGKALPPAEGGLHALLREAAGPDAVELDPVARAQDGELAQLRQRGEVACREAAPASSTDEPLPDLDGRPVVVRPDDEDSRRSSCGQGRPAGRARPGAGRRLASTGPSEARATAKRIRQAQAKRLATSRPRSRKPERRRVGRPRRRP